MTRVLRSTVPEAGDARADWLYDLWQDVDDWVEERFAAGSRGRQREHRGPAGGRRGSLLVLVTALWAVSVAVRDTSIVDIFWGSGFVVVAWAASRWRTEVAIVACSWRCL